MPIDRIRAMFALADDPDTRLFPPTELYSEGWMLRLVLDAAMRGAPCLPFVLAPGARWFSEARLASPFLPRMRGDRLAEGFTHADAVVGHLDVAGVTTAGVVPAAGATQFVVLEAKMGSKLSAGTRYAPDYDQLARNVAALAWTVTAEANAPPALTSLGVVVLAPARQLAAEPSFAHHADKANIRRKVADRIGLYVEDREAHDRLRRWFDGSFVPLLDSMVVACEPWEAALERVGATTEDGRVLSAFYQRCLHHNQPIRLAAGR